MVPFTPRETGAPALQPELKTLIERACAGDKAALEALIRRYQARIAKFVIAETGDPVHYEDLCQTVFVRMVLGLRRLRAHEQFESWLYQIARNACRDHHRLRRIWRRFFVPFDPAHETVAAPEDGADRERAAAVSRGIAKLPPDQQSLLRLALEEQHSYAELARLSRASIGAVKSRLHRARLNLRDILLTGEEE